MIVDLVRACYTTTCQFFNGIDLPIPIRWYFCHPEALPFPGHTRFASGNWASDRGAWPGTGEILGAPRPFYNGKRPKNTCNDVVFGDYLGKFFKGPKDSFEFGCTWGDPRLSTTEAGLCPDCMPLPEFVFIQIIHRRNPDDTQPWAEGDTIRLRHPSHLPVLPLDIVWQAEFSYWWDSGICGPLVFTFICGGGGPGFSAGGAAPIIYPDRISDDGKTFFWDDLPIYGNCNPNPPEHWTAVLWLDEKGPSVMRSRFWPGDYWPDGFFPPPLFP